MHPTPAVSSSRREFIKQTGAFTAASVLAGIALPHVHAAEANTLRLALIGCGGRGSGAADQALSTPHGPIQLVAMADVFEDKLQRSFNNLKQRHAADVDVPQDHQFVGFDAYKQAMDCLRPGDVVILATPPAFRWVHFTYAIAKGLHVFMEKPVTVDGPTSLKMLDLGKQSVAKNLKVGVGLMSRHGRHLQELADRVHNGEIGEIILQRGYRMHAPGGSFQTIARSGGIPETLYQIRNFHSFLWASGGCFSDFYIHVIDHCCWMKNAWPVKAQAVGGRHYKTDLEGRPYVDQNFDLYAVEYTYPDGTKFNFDGRCMTGCQDLYGSFLHGTKGCAIASRSGDCGGPSSIYKGQETKSANLLWTSKVAPDQADPYQNEWNELLAAIRADKPYNEVQRGVEASLVTSMGRAAAHTGQVITYDDMLHSAHEFAPGVGQLTADGAAPIVADAKGMYPQPEPGRKGTKEY